MESLPSIGVAIPTHQAELHLRRCMPPLRDSPLRPRILVVDSSSTDDTIEEARRLGAETLVLRPGEFNHGTTRELARRRLGTEIVVMVTQDAYAQDEFALGRLVTPVLAGEAAVAYGRQLPRPDAGAFETFLRAFNYPPESNIRSLADAEHYGANLSFCSNAFAAWRQSALDEVGGFPRTLSHEDAVAAALLLKAGHRIAYVADAVVEHSHPYSLRGDFKRYFDAGYARTDYSRELAFGGTHAAVGARYARQLFNEVARSRPWLLPYALAHLSCKALGYAAGVWVVRRAPMNARHTRRDVRVEDQASGTQRSSNDPNGSLRR